ncbi:TonB-linked SusC/RagA family outer membrane protein [Pedobacter sp. AK017]|uniref:SusC/RagA family TonB-linked outer membrane protein n=1 Tax=Pedobacter sp. AK017 TaxID=2723073 RepID=UPI0016135D40|nr:SusC/RagA family TonB-linked outer membrane protein [Pedobacter sp. AK017]MBB5441278.1 TonB-linked SusC/RagA family outer membrane protein [Pedobacter sp. AK017]
MKNANPVSIEVKNLDVEEVLAKIFANQPLDYNINLKSITVSEKEPSFLDRLADRWAVIDVRGIVVDSAGRALSGVNVTVKGSNISTVTNSNGDYSIKAADNGVLIFSFVGYEPQEVAVQGRNVINITMLESTGQLDQVQVIGYGTTTKRLATGNVSVMNSETIAKQPVSNPLQALIGRVAGLQITQTSGLPQSTMNVQIRGRNSILSSNEPLYIVDGVPFNNLTGTSYQNTISPLNSLSPYDIESISVLKDADATAIYGSRASNGVILITTKKGKSGKTQFSADVRTGFSNPSRSVEFMTTAQYLQVRRDAFANSGVTPTTVNAPDLLVWDQDTDNNLQDFYLANTARNTDVTASISGGSVQTTFLLNGNYHTENTVRSDEEDFSRANVHLNVSHRSIDQKFQLHFNSFYTSSNSYSKFFGQNLASFLELPPNYPLYNQNGTYNWSSINYVAASQAYERNGIYNINSNLVLQYTILPGLDFKSSLGYNRMGIDGSSITPSAAKDPASTNPLGSSIFTNAFNQSFLWEPQISFKKVIGKGNLHILTGATLQKSDSKQVSLTVSNYSSDLLLENPGFGTPTSSSGINSEYKYVSLFGRATYNLSDKYIVNGTFRRDGSTRFGNGKKFGNFGSIGAAWIFSKESFVKQNLPLWLSYGKLRGSWGTTGNDGTSDYQYLSTYSSTLRYGENLAIVPTRIANNDYSWEVNKKLEMALDLGLFSDRILFSTAWYRNRSGNQLVSYPLPSITGFAGYTANLPALVENTGWEFELNVKPITSDKLIWESSFNLTVPRNKLLEYPDIESSPYANNYVIGRSLNIVQQYNFQGVDPQTGVGLYQDVNGDDIYSSRSSYNGQGGDYVISGQTDPKWYAGLSNTFFVKGFQLDVFFQYTRQQGYNLFSTFNASNKGGGLLNGWTNFSSYWKQPGDQTQNPKPVHSTSIDERYRQSNAGFGDASFLRLKNVSLSYDIPQSILKRLKFSTMRFYAQGQNLWTKTSFVGYDPEMSASSFQGTSVPTLRTITFGLQCSL